MGEFWGYVLPGNPEAAAEYGRIDAEVAFHTNGVYGEMFIAAVTVEAFFETEPVLAAPTRTEKPVSVDWCAL